MEFWGVEVKAGQNLKVDPGFEKILHLSQAALGEAKKDKGNVSVPLYVNVDGQKLVIGTLSHEKCAQINFDLVFDKEFEISHSWKNGSVYFIGYKSVLPESEDFSDLGSDSEEEEEEIPLLVAENGKPEQKVAKPAPEKANAAPIKASAAKPEVSAAKPKVKIAEQVKVEKPKEDDEDDDSDDDDDEDDEDDSEDDESDDEDMLEAGDDSDEDDDSSDEEDEETPTPKKGNKKRPLDSAAKTPASDKKAKLVTPQKTDGKKGAVHTATPHPNKQAAKTPNSDKAKGSQTPKSGSQVSCKPCNKSFNSDGALQSHNKAKHTAAK